MIISSKNMVKAADQSSIPQWQLNNKEYLLAEANGDFVRQAALANMFVHSAKETIYPKMVYV